jgi:hypothetical protein
LVGRVDHRLLAVSGGSWAFLAISGFAQVALINTSPALSDSDCRLAAESQTSIRQIERAIRRTRRNTLDRIVDRVAALVTAKPCLGDPATLIDRLSSLAGSGLVPESEYRGRIEKRRKARHAELQRRFVYSYIVPLLDAELAAERRALRRTTTH